MGRLERIGIGVVTWSEYVRVVTGLRRFRLPDLIRRLERRPHRVRLPGLDPIRLGRLVFRVLNQGRHRPRCLTTSLVFFRMLARQGTAAQIVIGLPPEPTGHEAHAWVEVEGRVVGPPPGRLGHEEMVRYGAGSESRS